MSKRVAVILILFLWTCFCFEDIRAEDRFIEELFIKPLAPTHIYNYFQFLTIINGDSSFEHSHLSPRSLGEILSRFHVEQLHLTLTQGQWRHHQWGYPIIDAAPGVELYAWFSSDVTDVDAEWKKLSASLSGLFCASLNFIDSYNTINPRMALWPSGACKVSENVTSRLRYASLPREIVCTENLTPWKKLLPCESHYGFCSLLNSRMIHNTNYHSIGVHFRRICAKKDCQETELEIKQTMSLVYDNIMLNTKDWSLRKLFGQGLPGKCPLAMSSKIYVDVTSNDTQSFKLTPEPDSVVTSERGGSTTKLAVYNIESTGQMMNIYAKYNENHNIVMPLPPPLYFNRYILGYGKEFGGIVIDITNTYWTPINIVLLENAPWWLPIHLSSLRINGEADSPLLLSKFFSPGRSREKPYHLELLLKLPAKSTTTVSIEFEFVFLKWQEYPPDANHGFYIGSALITANLPTARNYTSIPITGSTIDSLFNSTQPWYPIVLRSNGAMVSMPTPDFSMPYNVICLACTVVALAFGPLHNITTKKLMLVLPPETPSYIDRLLNLFMRK